MREVTEVSGQAELALPPAMVEREPLLALLEPGSETARKLADELETAVAELDACKRRTAAAEVWVKSVSKALLAALEAGEGVQVPGALYFAAYGPDGQAEVAQSMVRVLAEVLEPFGLAPREEVRVRYPSVSAIRAKGRELRAAGIRVRSLVIDPPVTVKLRRRGVGTGEVSS